MNYNPTRYPEVATSEIAKKTGLSIQETEEIINLGWKSWTPIFFRQRIAKYVWILVLTIDSLIWENSKLNTLITQLEKELEDQKNQKLIAATKLGNSRDKIQKILDVINEQEIVELETTEE